MVVGFATVQLPVQNPCTTDRNPHLSYQTFLIPQPWKTDVLQIRALTSVSALKSLLRVPRVSKTIRRWWLWAMAGSGPGVTRSPLKCLRVGVPAEEQTSDLSISGWNQRSARLPLVVNYKEWDRRNQHCEVNLKQRQRRVETIHCLWWRQRKTEMVRCMKSFHASSSQQVVSNCSIC